MLTLRKTWFKAAAAELLWYLSGSTNANDLRAIGAKVWDRWDTAETAGSMGWADGELGPIYGAQWRDFGGRVYYPGGLVGHIRGFDQIAWVINLLKTEPNTKRAKVIGWHPADMQRCFVACCHGDLNFQVWGDRLHMEMSQRSGDAPIGVPFNTACYALLLLLMAQVTGYKPGTFYHHIWDPHIYEDQVPAMRELIKREPLPYPSIKINPDIGDIFAFTLDDFELVNYQSHPAMDVPVAT